MLFSFTKLKNQVTQIVLSQPNQKKILHAWHAYVSEVPALH